jgi:hypothetical protein
MKTIAALIITAFLALPAMAQVANVIPSTVNILPHRAFYTVKLKSADHESNVKGTDGRMIIELTHDCNGWTLKQESASVIELKGAQSEMMRSEYTAIESDDGKSLQFKTMRVFDEKVKDSVEGNASFNDKGGTISYKTPTTSEVNMNANTLPPIAHMKKLIETAQSGQKIYSKPVFDGSFFGNPVEINAVIGAKKNGTCSLGDKKSIVYPMNMAVYAMPSNSSNPNFQMIVDMGDDGIMCSYTIDFGDYTVLGSLDKIEYLPVDACTKKP